MLPSSLLAFPLSHQTTTSLEGEGEELQLLWVVERRFWGWVFAQRDRILSGDISSSHMAPGWGWQGQLVML